MTVAEIRKRYLDFFASRGHKIVPSASLVPENDPTTLFTGSGMQPLVPYLLGAPHPEGKRIVDSQKCFRAEDIDDVGDNRHTTFFEMLGNWSFGDYFKQEQLPWIFEFLTDKEEGAGLDPRNLYVTVFAGDKETGIPADDESVGIWRELFNKRGIEAKYVNIGSEKEGSENGMQGGRIFSYDVKKNWWSRSGEPAQMPPGEPGGPDSEVFYDFGPSTSSGRTRHDPKFGKECHPNCDCGRFVEIGNSVFMEYKKNEDGTFEKLKQRNVDFGGGLERTTAAANGESDMFSLDVFDEAKMSIEATTGKKYAGNEKEFRVVLDHMRAAVFILADGVVPSNTGRGYMLRRLLRRAVRFADKLGAQDSDKSLITDVAKTFINVYAEFDLTKHLDNIVPEMEKEEKKFRATLAAGLKEFEARAKTGTVAGKDAFDLYQSYGFPWELTEEMAKDRGLDVDRSAFEAEFEKHRELSRTASAGAFKGGLADHSERTTRLHTAHHLLLRALQTVLGSQVKQRGSNITSERLRMDFSYDSKMTEEQKKEAERIVNEKIAEDLPVIHSEMPKEEAEKLGAEHEFGQKYPERVSVYSVGPKGATAEKPQYEKAFSIEFCGGPHVSHTGEVGKFRIIKEEASSADVRRIRATVE